RWATQALSSWVETRLSQICETLEMRLHGRTLALSTGGRVSVCPAAVKRAVAVCCLGHARTFFRAAAEWQGCQRPCFLQTVALQGIPLGYPLNCFHAAAWRAAGLAGIVTILRF